MDLPKSTTDDGPKNDQFPLSNEPSTSTYNDQLTSAVSTTSVHDLPDEILDYIFSFLDIVQRIRLEIVCKRWYEVGRCPKELTFDSDFVPNRKFDDRVLCSVLSRCGPSLRKLVLNPNPYLTCSSLAKIGEYCPKLVAMELHLVDIQQVSCVKMLAPGCPNLKVVILQIHIKESEEDIGEINDDEGRNHWDNNHILSNGADQNNEVNLSNNSPDGANVHNEDNHNNNGADVNNEDNRNDDGNQNADVDDDDVEEEDGEDDEEKALETFFKTCNDAYNEGLLAIALNCKALEYLHVISLWTVALTWLDAINPDLHTFILENSGFTAEGMQCLMSRCNALKTFTVESCKQINQSMLFQLLKHYSRTLTILRIKYALDWFLSWGFALRDLVNLEVLDLLFCDRVGDALMQVIAKNCVKLRYLDIGGTDVTDVGLLALRQLPCLRELSITFHSTGVTSRGLKLLVAKGVLQKVTVSPFGSLKNVCRGLAMSHPNVRCIVED